MKLKSLKKALKIVAVGWISVTQLLVVKIFSDILHKGYFIATEPNMIVASVELALAFFSGLFSLYLIWETVEGQD